jgi:hypothetical protein
MQPEGSQQPATGPSPEPHVSSPCLDCVSLRSNSILSCHPRVGFAGCGNRKQLQAGLNVVYSRLATGRDKVSYENRVISLNACTRIDFLNMIAWYDTPYTSMRTNFVWLASLNTHLYLTTRRRRCNVCRWLLEKLMIAQLVIKIFAFHGTRRLTGPLVPILSDMNPVCTLTPYFFKIQFNSALPPPIYAQFVLIPPPYAWCPTHIIPLHLMTLIKSS